MTNFNVCSLHPATTLKHYNCHTNVKVMILPPNTTSVCSLWTKYILIYFSLIVLEMFTGVQSKLHTQVLLRAIHLCLHF
jgi:hypothetical protein